jgi:hypothetical protein
MPTLWAAAATPQTITTGLAVATTLTAMATRRFLDQGAT